ncbi:copper amine oxidase N-terminal domain-containing protein [Ureibacillus sinduriensis]|uniref:Copper amine oxidase-like N-terminal domain-containing protein n=1 Tax=Ureibacillus sinduriensis BLB-1 = JCM 15800 TaxID=1384057 RepID=A0A0A3HW96_9BACL|nr:copper amine oxidase N-terminal domain-containing protein [Ureibacillus sinduriensis]KGR76856.1 hypothetical protein CD33_05305 [Ureibacillus sinduriensis BLB-1 = JCM 15800]
MKKIKVILSVVLFAFAFSYLTANNANAAGNISIDINGEKQSFSNKAIVENGNTLVPLRGIFEELGATVYWNPETQTINAKKGNTDVWLKIGSKQTKVNGVVNYISVPAKVKNGSTLVPLRFISESLGATVDWNQKAKSIKITQGGSNSNSGSGSTVGYISSIKSLNPTEVEKKIKTNATNKWPSDYTMQAYVIENHTEAYEELVNLSITSDDQYNILEQAFKKWNYEFEMVQYTYENQLEAYKWMKSLNPNTDTKKKILQDAISKWGTDYEMVRYTYETQLKAYDSLN